MLDVNLLKGKIVENGLSQKKVAEHLGISNKTFYLKIKRGIFNSNEIEKMVNLLNIDNPMAIFFAKYGTQNATKCSLEQK